MSTCAGLKGPTGVGMVKPTAEQLEVERQFPAVAQWVPDGHVKIGYQEGFGSLS